MDTTNNKLTGYPSIDKPWLKYYNTATINSTLPNGNLFQFLYENNKNNLNDIALNYFGNRITYKALFDNIDMVAKSFTYLGVKKGDIITMMMINQPETVYCAYALNKIGAIINFVSVLTSESELVNYIKEAKSNVVVALDLFNEKLENTISQTSCENVINVSLSSSMSLVAKTIFNAKSKKISTSHNYITWKDFLNFSKEVNDIPIAPPVPHSFSFLAHTGGTTGVPKSVMLSDDAINGLVEEYKNNLHAKRKDKYLDIMVPFVVYGFVVSMHMPLCLGMETILIPKVDTEKLAKTYKRYKPNHVIAIPSYLAPINDIDEKSKRNLSFFKTVGAGGDGMTDDLETTLNTVLTNGGATAKVLNGYGMSELCSTACTCQPSITKLGSVGIPLSKNIISAFDVETGVEKKYGEVGEICIYSPYCMLGYMHNEKATNELIRLHDDGLRWVHTGDLGYVDADGVVYIKGRMKRIVLTLCNDFVSKIFPDHIEDILSSHPAIKNACVVPMNRGEDYIKLKAYVVPICNITESPEQIRKDILQLCKENLPEYSIPFEIEIIDKLPLTPVGKIDFKTLENMAKEQ